ncbi:hypothetical protein [Caballeronia sp. KNU42]
MALRDKHQALRFGLIRGIPTHLLNGEDVLYLDDVPYEWRDNDLQRWLILRPERFTDVGSPFFALRRKEYGQVAITWPTWVIFVEWIVGSLDAEIRNFLSDPSKSASVHNEAKTALLAQLRAETEPDLESVGVVERCSLKRPSINLSRDYIDDVPVLHALHIPIEFIGSICDWLSTSPENNVLGQSEEPWSAPAVLRSTDGRAVLTWEAWERFLSWMGGVLDERLAELDQQRDPSDRPPDIETEESGWAEKRRRQAQCREDVRTGKRTPESMSLFTPEFVRDCLFIRRSEDY